MPWTDESDPSSPSTTPPNRAPESGSSEGGRLDAASVDATSPEARRDGAAQKQPTGRKQAADQARAGPWGPSSGRLIGRRFRPNPTPPSAPAAASRSSPPRQSFESLTRRLRANVSERLQRPTSRRLRHRILIGAIVGFASGWALSGVYVVQPDERAVIVRVGAVQGVAGPGVHLHLPWPLEQAQILAVTRSNTLNLGGANDDGAQALTPTADGQLAAVTYAVHWRIADPDAYLFHLTDPQGALKLSAQAAMRQAMGAASLAGLEGVGRASIERRVATAIQQRLNRLGAGIVVSGVLIQAVALPPDVQAAGQDSVIARQDAQATRAEAEAYRGRVLAEAKANAAKTLIDAQSYRDQTLQEAQGAAARFDQLEAAYRKAPGVTKDRLYFETLQGVLSRAHTVILDPAKGATVTLPPAVLQGASPPLAGPAQGAAQSPPRAPSQGPGPTAGSTATPGGRP